MQPNGLILGLLDRLDILVCMYFFGYENFFTRVDIITIENKNDDAFSASGTKEIKILLQEF
jgi:hypothetical protein